MPEATAPPPPRPINPSLATLEKAVSARIYFEDLYFPLSRHPRSREQRKLVMERDMTELQSIRKRFYAPSGVKMKQTVFGMKGVRSMPLPSSNSRQPVTVCGWEALILHPLADVTPRCVWGRVSREGEE